MLTFIKDVALTVCNAYTARLNQGSVAATPKFVIYKGTVPPDVRSALGGDTGVLVTVPVAVDAFGDAADNAAVSCAESLLAAVADAPASATGTATFFRFFDRNNDAIWQGTVVLTGGNGDMELVSLTITAGVNVAVQSYVFRVAY